MKKLNCLLFSVLFSFNLWVCAKNDRSFSNQIPSELKKGVNILFIGNSYTYYNEGLDFNLQEMCNADASSDSISYYIQRVAKSSYTLEAHFNDFETLNKIAEAEWTNVVVQEQSTRPINNQGLFLEYATCLDGQIKKINAETSLFMTWARKDRPQDMSEIADSYLFVASQIEADVVAVGMVWEYFQKMNPQINLFNQDNKHPSLAGTYLTACVFFCKFVGGNLVANTYVPESMSVEEALVIRKAVFNYFTQNNN